MKYTQLPLLDTEEMVLTYVPEADHLSFDDAIELAFVRDFEAAVNLLFSILEAVNG